VEPYRLGEKSVYHIDLYRVSSESELEFLGWSELDDGLRLVEWPDRAPGLSEAADVRIGFAYEGGGRRADLAGMSQKGQDLLQRMDASTV
jgi:tRNA threonylcarbamoyladenosine biosynthesis protein TsaE